MTRLRVLVATTEGPSEVQQIVAEDAEVRSVVCLDGTSEALPISADYESFVRKPTGVIERLYGHASYRTDVSHPISGGRSWQLGLLVAHDLMASGRLATKGMAADEILWATGEVRHNLDVVGVDHVREKLRQSAGQLRAAAQAGARVTVLVPEANRAAAAAEIEALGLSQDVRVEGAQRWHGAAARKRQPRRVAAFVAATAAAVAVVAVAGYAAWMWRASSPAADLARLSDAPAPATVAASRPALPRGEMPPPPRPAPLPSSPSAAVEEAERSSPLAALNLDLVAVEFRPPAGRTCGGQRLTGGGLTETVVARAASGDFPRRTARGLCDVEFRVRNTGAAPRHIWLHVQPTLEGTHPRTGDATVDPGKALSLRVGASPWQSGSPWDATVIVAIDPESALAAAHRPSRAEGVQQLTDSLRAAHVTYEVVSYVAEAAGSPSYR